MQDYTCPPNANNHGLILICGPLRTIRVNKKINKSIKNILPIFYWSMSPCVTGPCFVNGLTKQKANAKTHARCSHQETIVIVKFN